MLKCFSDVIWERGIIGQPKKGPKSHLLPDAAKSCSKSMSSELKNTSSCLWICIIRFLIKLGCKFQMHWIISRAQNQIKSIRDVINRLRKFHCRTQCRYYWHLVYFRTFSFVYILHFCVLLNQQLCHP